MPRRKISFRCVVDGHFQDKPTRSAHHRNRLNETSLMPHTSKCSNHVLINELRKSLQHPNPQWRVSISENENEKTTGRECEPGEQGCRRKRPGGWAVRIECRWRMRRRRVAAAMVGRAWWRRHMGGGRSQGLAAQPSPRASLDVCCSTRILLICEARGGWRVHQLCRGLRATPSVWECEATKAAALCL